MMDDLLQHPVVRDRRVFRDLGQFPSDDQQPRTGEPLALLTGSSMLGGAQVTFIELAHACRAVGFDPTLVICRPHTAHPEIYRLYREFPTRRMTYDDFARLPKDQFARTHLFAQGLYRAGAGAFLLKLVAHHRFRSVSLRHASSCGLYPLRDWLHPAVQHIWVNSLFASRFDQDAADRPVRIHVLPPHISFAYWHRDPTARRSAWRAGCLTAGRAQRPDVHKFDPKVYRQWDQLRFMNVRFRSLGRDPRGLEPDWWEVLPFASMDARDFYGSLDVLLYQTDRTCQEAAGRVVIESMAQGVIPVVHDWGGMAEYIHHGQDGFVYHTWTDAKAILSYLRDDLAARRRISDAAIETAQRYDVSRYAAALWGSLHEAALDPLVYQEPRPGDYGKRPPVSLVAGMPIVRRRPVRQKA